MPAKLPEERTIAAVTGMQVSELVKTYGLTEELAVRLTASMQLAEHIANTPKRWLKTIIRDGAAVFAHFGPRMRELKVEQFWVILLDGKHRVQKEILCSQGTLTSSPVHPREVFAQAVSDSAAAIVLVHNHPSGDPSPSTDDISITSRLVEVGNLLGIRVVDHVIIGDGAYASLADRGLLMR